MNNVRLNKDYKPNNHNIIKIHVPSTKTNQPSSDRTSPNSTGKINGMLLEKRLKPIKPILYFFDKYFRHRIYVL